MKKKILIIDLPNLWMKTLYVCNYDNIEHLYYIINCIRNLYKSKQYDTIYLVIDGKNKTAKEKLSQYKAGRTKHKGAYEHLRVFVAVVGNYVRVVRNKDVEGDFVIAKLAIYFKEKDNEVTILSNDKDFLQLAQYNIKIADRIRDGKAQILTEEEILNKFKNSKKEPLDKLENILKYRVFKGDQSDRIPSAVRGLQDKAIREIINLWEGNDLTNETIDDIINKVEDEKVKLKLEESRKNILRNYELINLTSDDKGKILEGTCLLHKNKIEGKDIEKWQLKDWQMNW